VRAKRLHGLAALTVVVLLAGCSGGGGSGKSSPRVHAETGSPSGTLAPTRTFEPCTLLDTARADAFLRGKSREQFADARKCVRAAGKARLTLAVWQDQSRALYEKYRESRTDAQTVAGIGDAADYSARDNALQFLKGDLVITVQLENGAPPSAAIEPFLVAQAKYAATKV
jgi:hypothetical protein